MNLESSRESETDGKSINNDDIVRLVEKINREYDETLKRLAEIERQEREGEEAK